MLIKTKLVPPALKSRMLYRNALIDRLSAAKNRPLLLISGQAGSGKTSLVCQWVRPVIFS
jgi:ATP/maltotriose-dependent transcriptional regulator MalT